MSRRSLRSLLLPALAVAALLPAAAGCSGPCDKACARLVEQCRLAVDSYSVAPDGASARGCRAVDPGAELDLALCLEQCQDWQAAGAECLAAMSCGEDAGASSAPEAAACLDQRGRENADRDPTGASVSDCRADCDRQADACGKACMTSPGDAPTCAGCYDNCDKSRARCRGWCKLIGQ